MTDRHSFQHGRLTSVTQSESLARLSRSNRPTWLSILLVLLASFYLASPSLAQTDSEVSEEEAATEVEESDFDFFGNAPPISIDQLRQMQERFQEIAEDVSEATVSIQVGQNQGTGVVVTRDGYIMTAAHVIGGANREANVRFLDGSIKKATTLGLNRTVDSGLLKLDDEGKYPYLSPGISDDLKNGQWVMAIGHPGGWNEDRGLVFRIGRIMGQSDSAIATDCKVVGGDSGGPLVDMDGNVIAIHSRIGAQLTSNIHVPIDQFSSNWDDLKSGRDWGRGIGGSNPANEPWLGLSLESDSMVIDEIVDDGPSDNAGLKVGDQLIEFDGTRVPNQLRFRRVFRSHDPGDEVKVKIKREDQEIELELTIGSQAERD